MESFWRVACAENETVDGAIQRSAACASSAALPSENFVLANRGYGALARRSRVGIIVGGTTACSREIYKLYNLLLI